MRVIDITGQKFGRWIVLARGQNTPKGQARWLCRCECGNEGLVGGTQLRKGHSRSCGCYKADVTTERSTKHGHATNGISPTYHTWSGMVARCTNPNHRDHPNYGGRGITVYEPWLDFSGFLADMGEKPKGKTLDRIDNNGNYEPGNCRWVSNKRQARNKRNNRMLTLDGKIRPLPDWAEHLGIHPGTLSWRVNSGWSDERALTTPVRRFVKRR